MSLPSFLAELKRRNVYKVAAAYAVVAWLLIQVATQVFPFFEIPNWTIRLVVLLMVIGFPIALIIAWAFELTPQGLKRTETLDQLRVPPSKKQTWIFVIVIAGAMSIGLFLLGRYTASGGRREIADLPAKSIAVLPFANLSRDPDNAYFAAGIQDEIITRLSKVTDLKVISCSSTERFKNAQDDVSAVAKQLGVANILEGSVQRSADRVRINVQLMKAGADGHLWADTFDRKLTDIFEIESDIARTIAQTLQAKLTGSEQHAIAARPTENTEAHQLYLRGRYFWNKRTAADFKTAIGYFQQAIEKDPAFAPAYAGLADTYALMSGYAAASPKDSLPKAKAAARKAIELDNTLADAHASLGQALLAYDFDFEEATREFKRAIELNPNYATAHQWYAESVLAPLGRFDEAISEIKRAVDLDPLSVVINADVGGVLYNARRYDEAIQQLRKALEMDPGFYYAHWNLGQVLEMKGQTNEAISEYQKAASLDEDPLPSALLGRLYGRIGRRDEALRILDRLKQVAFTRYVSPYNFAIVYAGLGQKAEAIRFLEKTYEERDGFSIVFIKIDPLLDSLRGDPAFEQLAEKILGPKK